MTDGGDALAIVTCTCYLDPSTGALVTETHAQEGACHPRLASLLQLQSLGLILTELLSPFPGG